MHKQIAYVCVLTSRSLVMNVFAHVMLERAGAKKPDQFFPFPFALNGQSEVKEY